MKIESHCCNYLSFAWNWNVYLQPEFTQMRFLSFFLLCYTNNITKNEPLMWNFNELGLGNLNYNVIFDFFLVSRTNKLLQIVPHVSCIQSSFSQHFRQIVNLFFTFKIMETLSDTIVHLQKEILGNSIYAKLISVNGLGLTYYFYLLI